MIDHIEKWAKENGYEAFCLECYHICKPNKSYLSVNLEKMYNKDIKQKIHVQFYDNILVETKSLILFSECMEVYERNDMEEFFIPLNRVKRDEKLLKEYLESGDIR